MGPVLYVQVRPDRFIARRVGGGPAVDRMAPQPFSHPRALLANFTNAELFLRSLVAELGLGSGASRVTIWTGAVLSDAEVLEKLK